MEGIIFDFNGTMLFDGRIQEKAWREYLKRKIGRPVSDEEFREHIHGVNAEDTFKYFLNRDLEREEVVALEEEKEEIYRKLCLEDEEFKLAKGLKAFLDELKEANIPMTIATASNEPNVRFFFKHLGLDKWFSFDNVVLNDGTILGKPNPDIFLKAADKLGIDVEKCIIFEDSPSGIRAAKNANAKEIVGISSMLDKDQLIENGATYILEDFTDLDGIFKKIK